MKLRSGSPGAAAHGAHGIKTQVIAGGGESSSAQNSSKLKGRMNLIPGSSNLRATLAGAPALNKIQNQQNYMRGYSPSKPLWK
jgi:hypothetical protein